MYELPEELKKTYNHIKLATPEHEDFKKYAEITSLENPPTMEQFIDVAAFINLIVIPDRLGLTEKEKEIIAAYHLQNRMLKVIDIIGDHTKK